MDIQNTFELIKGKYAELGYDPESIAMIDARFPYCATLLRMPSGVLERQFDDFFELFIPTRSLELSEISGGLSRRVFKYRRGMVAFNPPGERWSISWDGIIEGVSVIIAPEVMGRAVRELFDEQPTAVQWRLALSDNAPAIAYVGLDLISQSAIDFPAGKSHFDLLVRTLFSMIIRRYGKTENRDTASVGVMSRTVLAAMQFVERHLGESIDVQTISDVAASSPAQLNRQFRNELGMSVWSYVRRRRLKRGAELLSQTDAPIATIASQIGFSTASNFTRAYKTEFGTQPTRNLDVSS